MPCPTWACWDQGEAGPLMNEANLKKTAENQPNPTKSPCLGQATCCTRRRHERAQPVTILSITVVSMQVCLLSCLFVMYVTFVVHVMYAVHVMYFMYDMYVMYAKYVMYATYVMYVMHVTYVCNVCDVCDLCDGCDVGDACMYAM